MHVPENITISLIANAALLTYREGREAGAV